jgi:phosphoglycerate dehydrogenase-like enzyme
MLNQAHEKYKVSTKCTWSLAISLLAPAALHVVATEPLPPESKLWSHPQIIIFPIPHSASTGDEENERLVALFCENLNRYSKQEPLLNQLDIVKMYKKDDLHLT